jgi:glycosyltransferase involved in cell wall biosynthesis
MNKPIVSVVMVVCNVERFLAEAIESILAQTFCDFEFIIVDYGSTDGSESIISSFAANDQRIKFHKIPHCSLPEARNAGCFLAQGEYIALIDADNISLPDRLKWGVEFMEKHPEVGVVGGGAEAIDATGASLRNSALPYGSAPRPLENRELQSALLSYCAVWQNSVLMRKEAFALVGGYRTLFLQAEDYDLWLRIAECFEMANLKQPVFKLRYHPYQLSVRKRTQQTLCYLAARASAVRRKAGQPDPLDSAKEITPAVLLALGVGYAEQQTALLYTYCAQVHCMCALGEWSGALNLAMEMLRSSSEWKYVDRRGIADMRLKAARVYWKNHQFLQSIFTAGHAVMTRPMLVGRPLKRLFVRPELS